MEWGRKWDVALVWLGWGRELDGGGVGRMSSIHPAGWPAPVLLKPEERHQTPEQMRHSPSPPTGAPSRARPNRQENCE